MLSASRNRLSGRLVLLLFPIGRLQRRSLREHRTDHGGQLKDAIVLPLPLNISRSTALRTSKRCMYVGGYAELADSPAAFTDVIVDDLSLAQYFRRLFIHAYLRELADAQVFRPLLRVAALGVPRHDRRSQLLDEARYTAGVAILDRALRPTRSERSRAWSRLAANDEPIKRRQVASEVHWPQRRLIRNEAQRRRRLDEQRHALVTGRLVLDRDP